MSTACADDEAINLSRWERQTGLIKSTVGIFLPLVASAASLALIAYRAASGQNLNSTLIVGSVLWVSPELFVVANSLLTQQLEGRPSHSLFLRLRSFYLCPRPTTYQQPTYILSSASTSSFLPVYQLDSCSTSSLSYAYQSHFFLLADQR